MHTCDALHKPSNIVASPEVFEFELGNVGGHCNWPVCDSFEHAGIHIDHIDTNPMTKESMNIHASMQGAVTDSEHNVSVVDPKLFAAQVVGTDD